MALKQLKIFTWWKGNNRERFLLFGIIAAIWLLITALEEFVPQKFLDLLPCNVSLALLSLLLLCMLFHSIFLFIAQYHRRKKPRELDTKYSPSIDIFISAHNEENVIKETLEFMMDLNYSDYKVYAINDRSNDSTLDLMGSVAAKHPEKLIILDRQADAVPGKAAALNDALRISNSEVICVFDADARVEKDFLRNIVPYLNDPLVGAVQSQKVISNPEKNFLVKCQYHEYAMDTYLQMGRDSIRGSVELRGNGQLIKRETLEHVGGWNEDTLTDDLDLSTCLHVNGWDIRFSPENKVYEEGVPSMPGLIKQRRRWAEGSMRRYLNYFLQLLKPGNLTLNQIFDTFVFLCQFSIPLWVSLDIIYEFIRYFSHRETYISFLMLLSISLSLIMFMNQFHGLRIYKQYSIIKSIAYSLITNFYFFGIWVTIIIITYRKILFSRTVGTWIRTEHGT
jgi:1,2-diacylglycerol 3-beta-glucosyltransferase